MATRIDLDNNPIKTMTVCIISRGGLIGSHLLLSMITMIKHASRLEGLIKIAKLVMLLWCIGGIRGGCIPMKEAEPMSMEHDWLVLQETKEESEVLCRSLVLSLSLLAEILPKFIPFLYGCSTSTYDNGIDGGSSKCGKLDLHEPEASFWEDSGSKSMKCIRNLLDRRVQFNEVEIRKLNEQLFMPV